MNKLLNMWMNKRENELMISDGKYRRRQTHTKLGKMRYEVKGAFFS